MRLDSAAGRDTVSDAVTAPFPQSVESVQRAAGNRLGEILAAEMSGADYADHEAAETLMATFIRQLSSIREFDQEAFAGVLADWVYDATDLDASVLRHVRKMARRAGAI